MNALDILKIVTIFVLGVFSIFLISYSRQGNRYSNVLLGTIIGFFALEALNSAFYRFGSFWMPQYPWVFYTTEFTFYLWGPILYFYFKATTQLTFEFKRKYILHLIPAFFHILLLVFTFHILSIKEKSMFLNMHSFPDRLQIIIHLGRNISVIIYLVFSRKLLNSHIKSHIGKDSQNINKSVFWLRFIFIIFCLVELIQIIHFVQIETLIFKDFIYSITNPVWFILSYLILFVALRNPQIFQYVPEYEKNKLDSLFSKDEITLILNQINKLLIEDKSYKDPDFNLENFASKLNITTKKLSRIINIHFDKNFSDFVNFYRIEEAKQLLVNEKYKNDTVLGIAFEVGFNSKSSFNRFFQKFTDTTPTDYRKNNA